MPTVLLVEDDALLRKCTAATLRDAGYGVVESGDARAALAHIREQGPADALVTGLDMPGSIDGLALADIVSRCWPETAIVICSGSASREAAKVMGCFLPEPYTPEQLVGAVSAAFHQPRSNPIRGRRESSVSPPPPSLS